jgi:hypothetical protein
VHDVVAGGDGRKSFATAKGSGVNTIKSLDTVKIEASAKYLVELLLDQPWHARCEIITDYMPPFPGKDTRPTIQVRYNDGSEYPPFLRYSQGPLQGYFWDIYGEHMNSVELAILALARAPAPRYVGPITFKIDLGKEENNKI